MSPPKKDSEKSPSGAPIYRYTEPTPWQAAGASAHLEDISDHIEKHLGKIETVFHELASDTVHIDVHFVKPNESCPNHRFVTSGMSDLPMRTPEGAGVPQFIELMITLPPSWHLNQESLKDENWYWPIHLLKFLAHFPHKNQTWLGFGHTMPNGDPPAPFGTNTALCGAILLPPVSVPQDFFRLKTGEKEIIFFSVVPLYKEEM